MNKLSGKDKYWSDYYADGKDFLPLSPQELELILKHVPKSASRTCLDIGCGTGQLTRELYHSKFKVVGIDISGVAIKLAKSLSTQPKSEISYFHHDFEKEGLVGLPFAPYGLVTCRLVYAFIDEEPKFIHEVRSVLEMAGVFIMITPLLDKTPEYKKKIAVDKQQTLKFLKETFVVDYFEQRDLAYFVCKVKE